MKFFVPDIRLPIESDQSDLSSERLGGHPVGLSSEKWPLCAECSKHMSLLAQFKHNDARLNLGRTGRILYIFQCNHDPGMCDTWEANSGANCVLVVEPEELITSSPAIESPPHDFEVVVESWIEKNDHIHSDEAKLFFSEQGISSFTDELRTRANKFVTWSTKLGSVPTFIQSADESPGDNWKYIAQLDSTYSFYSPPKTENKNILADEEKYEGRSHYSVGPNFGDGGIAYVFLRNRSGAPPKGLMFWQCG